MAAIPEPVPSMATAMNWELPAKTTTDMSPMASGERPAFWASTPKARPIGTYPRQMGHAARMPSFRTEVLSSVAAGVGIYIVNSATIGVWSEVFSAFLGSRSM